MRPLSRLPFVLVGLLLTVAIVAAQPGAQTCPAVVSQALQSVGGNCDPLDRSSACYGYNAVTAQFNTETSPGFFTSIGEKSTLNIIDRIATSPLDVATNEYGVAVLSLQANIPNTLPGQVVRFLLLGSTEVEGADNLPGLGERPTLTLTVAAPAPLLSSPESDNVITTVPAGSSVIADGLSLSGGWVRAAYNESAGWIPVDTLADASGLSALQPLSTAPQTPFQAFYLRTGVGQVACDQAPNSLVVQGPETMTVDFNVNGADVRIGSTVILRVLPPGNILELIVVDGEAILYPDTPDEIVVRAGEYTQICLDTPGNLGSDGAENDRPVGPGCRWTTPRPFGDFNQFTTLERIPVNVLNYGIVLPEPPPDQPNTPTPTPTVVGGAPSVTATPTAVAPPPDDDDDDNSDPDDDVRGIQVRVSDASASEAVFLPEKISRFERSVRGANADTAAEPLFLNAGGPSFGEDLVFNVSLSRTPTASEGDVIVSYETSDTCGSNSATPADDFIPLTGTLTFPPGGSTADEVVVQVYTDGETEADETVCLKLIDITPNADIVDAQGIGTILDDDVLDLFVADTSVTEGDSGTSSTTVQVSAIGSSANDIIVNYELDTYSATEGIDFVDESGSVTIFSSVGYATLDVSIIGDNIDESDEALTVDLLNASGAPVNNLFDGRVTITDNDAVLSVNTSGGTSATEDGTITLTAQLNQTVPNDVTVNWSLTFGSGYTEAISTDVESSSLSGTATIFANTPSTTITIDTEGDSLYEADETFYFDMNTSASNITEGTTSATLTIDDDDTQPTVKIYTSSSCTGGSTTSVGEGDPPDANSATLYVCLIGGTSGENVLVDYDHVPGSADTSDYVEDSGTVTVTAGSTSTTILSAVEADDTYENGGNDETYTVEISNARGASSSIHYSITTNSAEVRITEDD